MPQRICAGGTVPFAELVGAPKLSRRITANRKKRGETRAGIIKWVDIDLMFAQCLPPPPALPGVHPTVPYLFVEQIDVSPWPQQPGAAQYTFDSNIVNYNEAIVVVKYAPLPYDSTTLVTRKSTYSAEVQLIPASGAKWQDTGDPVKSGDTQSGKVIPMVDHTFEFHRVPPTKETSLDATVRSFVGQINTSTYSGIPAETLLFKGASKSWAIDSSGQQTFTYGMQFKERNLKIGNETKGWNDFFRNEDGTYQTLLTKDDETIYSTTSQFSSLFQI